MQENYFPQFQNENPGGLLGGIQGSSNPKYSNTQYQQYLSSQYDQFQDQSQYQNYQSSANQFDYSSQTRYQVNSKQKQGQSIMPLVENQQKQLSLQPVAQFINSANLNQNNEPFFNNQAVVQIKGTKMSQSINLNNPEFKNQLQQKQTHQSNHSEVAILKNLQVFKEGYTCPDLITPEPLDCLIENANEQGALYIGNIDAAMTPEILRAHNIKAVLTASIETGVQYDTSMGINHYCVPAHDKDFYDITQHFEKAIQFIELNRFQGSVLVHCFAGISRSAAICIAYIMKKFNLKLEKALWYVKRRRRLVNPNSGFINRLTEWEAYLEGSSQGLAQPGNYQTMPMGQQQSFQQIKTQPRQQSQQQQLMQQQYQPMGMQSTAQTYQSAQSIQQVSSLQPMSQMSNSQPMAQHQNVQQISSTQIQTMQQAQQLQQMQMQNIQSMQQMQSMQSMQQLQSIQQMQSIQANQPMQQNTQNQNLQQGQYLQTPQPSQSLSVVQSMQAMSSLQQMQQMQQIPDGFALQQQEFMKQPSNSQTDQLIQQYQNSLKQLQSRDKISKKNSFQDGLYFENQLANQLKC